MMQSEFPLLYSDFSAAYSCLDPTDLYNFPMADSNYSDFSSSFSPHDSSGGVSMDLFFASLTPNNLIDFPAFSVDKEIMYECDWMEVNDCSQGIVSSSSSDLTSEGSAPDWSPSMSTTTGSPVNNMDLRLPGIGNDNVEMDTQLVLHHLLKAYGEAMEETDGKELMEVIAKRVNETIDPLGDSFERLAFNLLNSAEHHQSRYLRHQSSQNYDVAFKVFYEMFPYGRFAHFTANSAILESIPKSVETIHIVDFDMGNGIQWPSMIEAIAQTGKALRLTSIKPDVEGSLEETNRRLYDHARSLGLSLRIEEMSLVDLTTEIKRTNKRSQGRDWLAFNCMVGLPHMCSKRNRNDVTEFLNVAKELLAYVAHGNKNHAGILTFGDGETVDDLETNDGYRRYNHYFNSQLMHYQALLESMECSINFPTYLREARLAMENLFVAPNICSDSWLEQWKHGREGRGVTGLEGKRISKECLNEAREMVNEKESSYKVNILGEKRNQLVLEWKSIPLIQVSSWFSC